MDRKALKSAVIMAGIMLAVFEVIVFMAYVINPEGLIFHLDFREPLDQLIILGCAAVCGISVYAREAARNKQNAILELKQNKAEESDARDDLI